MVFITKSTYCNATAKSHMGDCSALHSESLYENTLAKQHKLTTKSLEKMQQMLKF